MEWDYLPATEKAKRRLPDAGLVKESSGTYSLVETMSAHTPFGYPGMTLNDRIVQTIY